ncbi:MAG TPA: family 16 glycoside hydrolase, partial [Desulfuromonadaceae bacterium]|nr:family 16 glycoside hydrolase [Desulfuromonadaceae bacterium]
IPSDWSVLSGNRDQWSSANGVITGHSTTGESILASTKQYRNVTLSGILSSTNRGADLAIRMQDADNGYLVTVTPDGTPWAAENGSIIKLVRKVAGTELNLAQFKRSNLPQSAKITVIAKGPQFEVRLNDTAVLQARDTKFAAGYIGVRVYGDPVKPSDAAFSHLTVR